MFSGQNGVCLSFCWKQGVLWGIFLASGWECRATNRKVAGSIPAGVSGFL